MTRERVSRPSWSVPNSDCASGGLFMRRKLVLSGSWGATQGAAMAITIISTPTTPPTADSVLRRAKVTSSRRTDRWLGASAGSGIADSGIEPRIAQVDEEIHEDEDDGIEQDEILHHDDVALDQRGDQRAAEAGDAKGLLHGHRAAKHEAQEHAGDGDHGEERVGQGVAQHHVPLLGALGPGRAHVVLADDLEQTRAGHPRDVGTLGQAENDGGSDHDLEVLPWRLPEVDDDDGRLVAEPEEEGEHDEHAEPEAGNGDEQDGRRAGHVVGPAVGLDRAHDAHGEADEPRHDEGEDTDLRADRPAVQDKLGHGVASEEGLAQLPRDDVMEPVEVLDGKRIGQTEVVHDADTVGRRHLRDALYAEDGHEGIAGEDAQNDEDDERYADERTQGEEQPPDEILAHGCGSLHPHSRPAGSGASG